MCCWYHARAKFDDARANAPIKAKEAIDWIAKLFEVEDAADKANDTLQERLSRRRRDCVPIIATLQRWMDEVQKVFAPDEAMFKAIQYCRNHWQALVRFLSDGQIPLSNNLAERELGVIGRGRKAYLFAGSDEGGHRLAKLYTVVRTCERLDIDPFAFMADALPQLSVMQANRGRGHMKTFMPWAWRRAQTQQ